MDRSILNSNYCIKYGSDVTTYGVYRLSLFIHCISGISSIVLIIVILRRYLQTISLHVNLRVLLMLYYATIIGLSAVQFVTQIIPLVRSFVYYDPCSFFVDPSTYAVLHVLFAFFTTSQAYLHTTLWIERLIATLSPTKYETWGPRMATVMLTVAEVGSVVTCVFAYYDETFTDIVINYTIIPSSAAPKLNIFFLFFISLSFAGFIASVGMYEYNKHHRQRIHATLGTSYQISENIRATEFIAGISVLSTTVYALFSVAGMVLRANRAAFFGDNDPLYFAMRSFAMLIPELELLVALLSIWILRRQIMMSSNSMREITKKISSADEAEMYRGMLEKQWSIALI